jgi:PelA/Pel-15E family pectate lyase
MAPMAHSRLVSQGIVVMAMAIMVAADAEAQTSMRDAAGAALFRAARFFHEQVSTEGGYVWRYSADLAKREGEGRVTTPTVWVQPPGTPAVGLAYLQAHEATGDAYYLHAARAAGEIMLRGQLQSGGWGYHRIELRSDRRRRYAYRVDGDQAGQRNTSTLDDNSTQCAIRFMASLDKALDFRDPRIHEATVYALDQLVAAQFANGGFPQGFDGPADSQSYPKDLRATPGKPVPRIKEYWKYATLNDDLMLDVIEALLLAAEIYREHRYRAAALRAGQFLVLAQLPEPQPGWAQQYDAKMQPAWARKFEPPSISGGESRGAILALMRLHRETGDVKWLAPIEPALAYFRRSRLNDGRLARFYEMGTNRPLYFNRKYELTYHDHDLPTHYTFKVADWTDALARRYAEVKQLSPEQLQRVATRPKPTEKQVQAVIKALDQRGAWVEVGRLRYHGSNDTTTHIIDCGTFIRNVRLLSDCLATR